MKKLQTLKKTLAEEKTFARQNKLKYSIIRLQFCLSNDGLMFNLGYTYMISVTVTDEYRRVQ
jgi:hypothetical protein